MAKAESEPKAEVEVRTIKSTHPDEIATITVGGEKVELFETDENPTLRALRNRKGIIVEASWNEFAYGINQDGGLTDNPHFLEQGEEMSIRANGSRGILEGIPDSSRITHLKPKTKK